MMQPDGHPCGGRIKAVGGCERNPRNCALHDNHSGPCIGALEFSKLMQRSTEKLMTELSEGNNDG